MTNIKKLKKYQQVVTAIIGDIEAGKLKSNQQLTSENNLAEAHNVSRITIRKALNELVLSNYITKAQGRCTIINNQIVNKKLNEIVSFTKSSLLRNELPTTRVIKIELIEPSAYIAGALNIEIDSPVWHLQRVRYTNGFPLIYEESYWVKEIIGIITEQNATSSMFNFIKTIGIIPKLAKQDLDAVIADTALAKELDVHVGFPLLRSTMVFYDAKNIPFEISFNFHRTDRIKLSLIRNLRE